MTWFVLALALGCQGSPVSTAALDRAAYAESVETLRANPAGAAQACLRISDPLLLGECVALAAKQLAGEKGPERQRPALALCERIGHAGWAAACFFEVSDGAGLVGPDAVLACGRSGDFLDRCLDHALGRHVQREWRVVGLGQEAELASWVRVRLDEYGITEDQDGVVQHFVARAIAQREGEGRFGRSWCGVADDATCREAYRNFVWESTRTRDVRSVCSGPLSREAVEGAGLPGWDDDMADLASDVWGAVCKRYTGQGTPGRR